MMNSKYMGFNNCKMKLWCQMDFHLSISYNIVNMLLLSITSKNIPSILWDILLEEIVFISQYLQVEEDIEQWYHTST